MTQTAEVFEKDEKMTTRRTELSVYTQELKKMLLAIDQNETIKYETLSEKIGMDVKAQGKGYRYQKSARDILEREHHIVFEPVQTVGLKRVSAERVALGTADLYIRGKKSLIKRSKRRINTVNNKYEELSNEAKMQANFARTLIAFDDEAMKRKNTKKIENKVKQTQGLVGFNNTLELFKD